MRPTKHEFKHAVDLMMKHEPDGTYWLKVGENKDGKTVAIVIGWSVDYERGEEYQKFVTVNGVTMVYTLVAKIAYNCDDMQCDYDYDWHMPCTEDGDVYDTDHAVCANSYDYLMSELDFVLEIIDNVC